MAKSAYIRSAVLLIYASTPSLVQFRIGAARENYLIVLVTPGVVLPHAQDEVEDRHEGPDSVRISSEHDVAEADVIVSRHMASSNPGEGRLEHRTL